MRLKTLSSQIVAVLLFTLCLVPCLTKAQTNAPGAPGKDAQWASAGKQAVGTSASLESKVWFTLQGGALTDVYYPDVTVANVHVLQFVVVNPKTKKVETERDDANHQVTLKTPQNYPANSALAATSLSFQQINTAKSGEWRISKTYITDPKRNTVLMNVLFQTKNKDLELYVYHDPSLANTGMHDTAWSENGVMLAQDKDKVSALALSFNNSPAEFSKISNGFYQTSDGLEQLQQNGSLTTLYSRAERGNVAQIAQINVQKLRKSFDGYQAAPPFTLALGFGTTSTEAVKSAKDSLADGFDKCFAEYYAGWTDYVKTLRKVEPKYQAQFNMAAMVLKAHEDKGVRGANIASLSVPWGGGVNANEDVGGGYHLVWSRDLYQVVTAYLALGDVAAANRALDFLFKIQQKPDGSFPQNSWLDGRPSWNSLQLDEVAYPLIMAYQLGRNDKDTYEKHVKKAADFLIKNGPKTVQERWEEEAGYSPSTIAAEIAGLVCAADIARKNGDEASATIYLAAADDWARNIERWTVTTTGKYGDGNYYVRITQNGNPDAGDKIELNNGAGVFDEREIVDAGFLELVRLGIKPPDDPLIAKSVEVIDQNLRVVTPNGEAFYRYTRDGYGEMDDGRRWNWDGKYTGKGRLWALLSGERGQYELAQYAYGKEMHGDKPLPRGYTKWELISRQLERRLDAMLGFANEGLMIPEQVWDKKEVPANIDKQFVPELKFGEGTGSATPLAWSMAQFIRLTVNLQEGRNLETPDIVYNRYVKNGIPRQVSGFGSGDSEVTLPDLKTGDVFETTRGIPPGSKAAYLLDNGTRTFTKVDGNELPIKFQIPENDTIGILAVEAPDGSTAFERVKLRPARSVKPQEFSAATLEKIKTAKASPIIENGKAIFIYRGNAKRVQLAGDFTFWSPTGLFLQDIGDGVKAAAMDFPSTARVEYKIITDGEWIADPLNPNSLDNGVGSRNSYFAMPDYKPSELALGEDKKLEEFEIASQKFGARKIKVYLPQSYAASKNTYPVLYVQDGSEYFSKAGAANVQESLLKQNKIKPFIIVFIDPKERTKEYWANDDWADFVANELVPEVDKRYRTVKTREGRALIGASLGGITSVWIGLKHPNKFARIGGQSSSFWVDNERVVRELSQLDPQQTSYRFYFDDGVLEGTEDSRRVAVMLRGKGFPVTYREEQTGHNWTSWRDRLADAYIALWK
jgi:glucan 1,4-alpha-glucosidase